MNMTTFNNRPSSFNWADDDEDDWNLEDYLAKHEEIKSSTSQEVCPSHNRSAALENHNDLQIIVDSEPAEDDALWETTSVDNTQANTQSTALFQLPGDHQLYYSSDPQSWPFAPPSPSWRPINLCDLVGPPAYTELRAYNNGELAKNERTNYYINWRTIKMTVSATSKMRFDIPMLLKPSRLHEVMQHEEDVDTTQEMPSTSINTAFTQASAAEIEGINDFIRQDLDLLDYSSESDVHPPETPSTSPSNYGDDNVFEQDFTGAAADMWHVSSLAMSNPDHNFGPIQDANATMDTSDADEVPLFDEPDDAKSDATTKLLLSHVPSNIKCGHSQSFDLTEISSKIEWTSNLSFATIKSSISPWTVIGFIAAASIIGGCLVQRR